MKKTITVLLLTALCMTVFTSCDLGGGLVAELLGGISREDEHIYPIDDCIEEPRGTEIAPVEPIPPEEIQTTQYYGFMTEPNTTAPPETGCDCGQCDLNAPNEPKPTHSFFLTTLVAVVNGEQVVDRFFTQNEKQNWNDHADVDDSISELVVRGCWRCPERNVLLGYSINGGEVVWDESFVVDKYREWTIDGTAYLSDCDIVIPVSELSTGSYTVTCYARANDEQGEYTMQMIEFVINRVDTITIAETEAEDVSVEEPIID